MKIYRASKPHQPCEHGFFLIIVLLAVTGIMLIYLTVNARRLATLKQDLRLVEHKQVQRLNPAAFAVRTNQPPAPTALAP